MRIEPADIAGLFVIRPEKRCDRRGFFSEIFKRDKFAELGVDADWVQENHSLSTSRGVVRGLHFQGEPNAQAKLVRVTRGAILDVAVDIRKSSPTYGAHVAIELSAENWRQLYVPIGFAHGFCTLCDDTEVIYKVSTNYSPSDEGGLLWNDPHLGIAWPVSDNEATLSERDRSWPSFEDLNSPF